jgi:hypothetical protein
VASVFSEQVIDAREPAELAAQDSELPADIDSGGDRLIREVSGTDEDRLVMDFVLAAEEVAKGEHVDRGLYGGGRDLGRVSLTVDDGEAFDLDDVELAVQLERDQVRF